MYSVQAQSNMAAYYGICLMITIAAVIGGSSAIAVALPKFQCNAGFYKYPSCENTAAGYWCECGTGFEWNSKICMTDSVDSRLEFKKIFPASYAILLGKTLPSLQSFTVAAWMKIDGKVVDAEPTLIAYGVGQKDNVYVSVGRNFKLEIGNETAIVNDWGVEVARWMHVAVTWQKDGAWNLFKNGVRVTKTPHTLHNSTLTLAKAMEAGGDLTIGHSINRIIHERHAFLGELSHVHVWNSTLNASSIRKIATDCTFTYCGNVAEWVDFRSGTRGEVKLRWPSKIFAECVVNKAGDCDSHCSQTIGPQCNQEHEKNILWPRTPTGYNSSQPCPGTGSGFATRTCEEKDLVGVWEEANASDCISSALRDLRNEMNRTIFTNNTHIMKYLRRLNNMTWTKKTNPTDISASVDCLRMIVDAQTNAFDKWEDVATSTEKKPVYPTFDETKQFTQWVTYVVDNIIDKRNEVGWNATLPRGSQAVHLLEVMVQFVDLFSLSYLRHLKRGDISITEGKQAYVGNNIAIYVEIVNPFEFTGSFFPDTETGNMALMNPDLGRASIPDTLFDNLDEELQETHMAVFYVRYDELADYLPNHPERAIIKYYRDKEKEHRHKEDNVNSVVITTGVYAEEDIGSPFANLTDPVEIDLKFTIPFNVSNPECVFIDITGGRNQWTWRTSEANISLDGDKVTCTYYRLGTFAVTTDMYDVNWDPGEPRRFVVTAAGYIGILIFTVMVATSLVVFFYLRCSTETVAVHRNLAVSLICLHILFMIGITRQENATVCKIFAIAIHFFFASSFCWICNEAFNLYIEVANSIHADTQQQRPMLRYYVIGWAVPAIMVAALVQSKWDSYFSPDVCFIDFQHIWLFAGPAGGMWAITVFVLVYTGKDIMESSYSKDKEANKVISNHCKGCWIQVVLMAIAWTFALISVDMYSIIPQILFAMFDILQGAFFFVFFCTLDGEVTEILTERRSAMGFNVSPHGLQRSTKYSVYRRYLPPRSSARRTHAPSHIQSASTQASAQPMALADHPRENIELQSQHASSWAGGGIGAAGDRSPSLVRWGTAAMQALKKQHLARKESDAKREVLARFFSDEEVKDAFQSPPPAPESEEMRVSKDDHLVTSV